MVEDHPASRQILSLQLEALGAKVQVADSAKSALKLLGEHRFDLMLTDQSMPGMQGSELAKEVRASGHGELVIIGVTADIYALDSRHQFLSAGMNGVLIKPLSLNALENELSRYFIAIQLEADAPRPDSSEYSFDIFSNLIEDNPTQVVLILDEIKKVHDDVLVELEGLVSKNTLSEDQFNSMIHKIKGGAQLLNARSFVEQCQNLERDGDLYQRIRLLTALLERENQVIKHYQDQYRH